MPISFIAAALAAGAVSLVGASGQGQMNARGAQAMGFDQDRTTHHFLLYEDGGAIDVSVNDRADAANRDAIRAHLPHVAMLFRQGVFDLPHFIHGTNVPGTTSMSQRKDRIKYHFSQTPAGGRVDIVTADQDALTAIHAFLRFQITDHQTGDSLDVKKR